MSQGMGKGHHASGQGTGTWAFQSRPTAKRSRVTEYQCTDYHRLALYLNQSIMELLV
jgi:hypothetical protein